jgi:hypothetical protein
MKQPSQETENNPGGGNGPDSGEEDFHSGGIAKEAVAGGPVDFGTGLKEESELNGRGAPGNKTKQKGLRSDSHPADGASHHCNKVTGGGGMSRTKRSLRRMLTTIANEIPAQGTATIPARR